MNRGHGRERILAGDKNKITFLSILSSARKKLKIRILAYCLMDNHYHLVIENSTGRMADFFKRLNGEYGTAYRRNHGGEGYVFQGRFKSTLIQDEGYLLMAISYVLGNPVRAGIVGDFLQYQWSSASLYFNSDSSGLIDNVFVEELYGDAEEMRDHVRGWEKRKVELPVIHTEFGPVLAQEDGIGVLKERFERRSGRESLERKRKDDDGFEPVARIYQEFCERNGIKPDRIDFGSRYGQQLRRQLLVQLKDLGGLKYREIIKLPEFSTLKMNALGSLYRYEQQKK